MAVAPLLTLLLFISQAPVVPLPCTPGELTVVCNCKQGMASACAALAGTDEEALKNILRMAVIAKAAEEAKKREGAGTAVDTGCGSGQDPNGDDGKQKCTGQAHHLISKTVWLALENHDLLRGRYRYRDARFVARAKNLEAHCGWQDWHRNLDQEIARWIRDNGQATAQQFEAYLREVTLDPSCA